MFLGPITLGVLEQYVNENDKETLHKTHDKIGTTVTHIVIGLLNRGFDVTVYTLSRFVNNLTVIKGNNLTIYIGQYRKKHRARDFFKEEIKSLYEAIKSTSTDILHAHWTYEYSIAALFSGKPTLITLHDWAPAIFRLNPTPYRFIRFLMNIYTLFNGKYFTVNSRYLQKKMEYWGYTDIPLIPNFLSENIFCDEEKKYSTKSFKIISINNGFSKWKNVKVLIKAFKLIRIKNPCTKLLLVGSSYEKNGIAYKWAVKNNFSEGIVFCGPTPFQDVQKYLQTSDLLIHPSLEESFGCTLIEAMAQKIPVIEEEKRVEQFHGFWITGMQVCWLILLLPKLLQKQQLIYLQTK